MAKPEKLLEEHSWSFICIPSVIFLSKLVWQSGQYLGIGASAIQNKSVLQARTGMC